MAKHDDEAYAAETVWEWCNHDRADGVVIVRLGGWELGQIPFDECLGNKPSVRSEIEEIVQQAYDTGFAHGEHKARTEFSSVVRALNEFAK